MFLWRETGPIEWYVEQGYAYVHADVRGTGISGGEFGFLSRAEQLDLHDVIEWIARQKWSNGKVGASGSRITACRSGSWAYRTRRTWPASHPMTG